MYTPEFAGPIEGYVHNYLKKHFWRVSASMQYQDVIQEAQLLFYELVAKYPLVDTPQWFMTLFKRSFANKIHDLSKVDTNIRKGITITNMSVDADTSTGPEIALETLVGETGNAGYMTRLIAQAPEEVRSVMNLLANAPTELLDLASGAWKDQGKKKQLGNQMLCRMLGRDHTKEDLVAQTEEYFSS